MKWKNQLTGMKPYQPGRSIDEVKKMYGLDHIVKLASNENPFGTSPKVSEFLENQATNHAIYPDGYASSLRQALAEALGVEEQQLLFGNGSDEIIMMISRALLQPGVNTVMAIPTFPQYRHNAVIEGAEVREVQLKDGAHNMEEMTRQIDDNTAVVWLCSPNNPTGMLIGQQKLEQFVQKISEDVLIVIDEAYFEYITDPTYKNSLELVKKHSNVIVLRTFSKAYGLAGFRVGYAVAQKELIARLDPVREPFNNTVISQGAALTALHDSSFIEKCVIENESGKKQFQEYATKHNLHLYPSQGNFVLLQVKADSDTVFEGLLKKGFIIRSGNALGTPGYIRITIGTRQQNEVFLQSLTEVLTELEVLA
ncbi:histidinol-phosphate transaminase [Paenisporosarcina quisquiliarum]|uniref:Histidinol-phosphate aminotransferase n=1 Tax=Paenisporosarcina quisquiliarum TaxID=365346 RepID=A0A9X3LDC4_9BACL|nr:histidinol-phosphate transaminase [Paenisporosarcina quisquiliarum]MCZ8535783.1 histidinol-phosphate transaminase [Paenisporosarcina quisquiliarum]